MEDLLEFLVGELQPGEAVDLRDRVPEGVVGAVGHALRAVAVDVFFGHAPLLV